MPSVMMDIVATAREGLGVYQASRQPMHVEFIGSVH